MQISSGIAPSPATSQAFGSRQDPGIAETPERSTRVDDSAQTDRRVEAPARETRSEPPPARAEARAAEDSSPPRGSHVDIEA